MEMRFKLYMILSLLSFFWAAARDYNIASPDGKISVAIGENGNYNVVYNGIQTFSGSAGLTFTSGKNICEVKDPQTKR